MDVTALAKGYDWLYAPAHTAKAYLKRHRAFVDIFIITSVYIHTTSLYHSNLIRIFMTDQPEVKQVETT
jgi:hypothetical protein